MSGDNMAVLTHKSLSPVVLEPESRTQAQVTQSWEVPTSGRQNWPGSPSEASLLEVTLNSSHSFAPVYLAMFSLERDWQGSRLTRSTERNLPPVFILVLTPVGSCVTHLGNAELLQNPLQRE